MVLVPLPLLLLQTFLTCSVSVSAAPRQEETIRRTLAVHGTCRPFTCCGPNYAYAYACTCACTYNILPQASTRSAFDRSAAPPLPKPLPAHRRRIPLALLLGLSPGGSAGLAF